MEKMIQNARTISFTHTNTQNKIPVEIVSKIYQLIPFYKNEQQNLFQRENHLKQDMINIPNNLLTSLTSIKILFELITDPTIPEAEKKEYISIFQKKIENLMIMTNEFHELSKNETTDKPLVMEQQFLDKIVAEAMFFFHDEFVKKQIHVQIDDVSVPPIFADRNATNRIIHNIIENALHYAKSYFSIHFLEKEDYVHFKAIHDFDQTNFKDMEIIFNRIYRFNVSRTDPQLGQGLHIVKKLIHEQGGKVIADILTNQFLFEVAFKKWEK